MDKILFIVSMSNTYNTVYSIQYTVENLAYSDCKVTLTQCVVRVVNILQILHYKIKNTTYSSKLLIFITV